MSSKPNISSRIIKKPAFLENIGLKGAFKVFFIILLLGILFFIIWSIIKPENIKNSIGLVRVPQDGPLVPVDDSKCGVDIIECGDYTDCVKQCSMTGTNMNYQCTTIPSGKEVYYLGTVLPTGKSFCLPMEDSGGGNNNTITKCATHLGRVVRSLNPDGKLGWDCECKYPSVFGGPSCNQQVACQVEITDQNGITSLKTGPLISYNNDGTPTQATGATGTTLQYIEFQPDSPDNNLEDTLPDGSPRWRCYCGDENRTQGAVSLPNDYYACYQDRCYAGQGAEGLGTGGTYFDTTKNECVCNPGVTFKSNVDGFCYPLEQDMMNLCRDNSNKGCLCGLELIIRNGTTNVYEGAIFRWKGKYYLSQVFKEDGDITTNLSDVGTIKLVEIDPALYNVGNWNYWWIQNWYPGSGGYAVVNILTNSILSNSVVNFKNDGIWIPPQTITPSTSIPTFLPGSVSNNNYTLNMFNFGYEQLSSNTVTATMVLDNFLGAYVWPYGSEQNWIGEPITISVILNPLDQNYNSAIVDLTGSYLDFYVSMLEIVPLNKLSTPNIIKFYANWLTSIQNLNYNQEFIVEKINNDKLFSNGLIPFPCQSYYYTREGAKLCNDPSFLGDNTVGNSLLNPIGIVCTDLCTINDPCQTKVKNITRGDKKSCTYSQKCTINPFTFGGYSCYCGSNDPSDTSTCFYSINKDGKDFCEVKIPDCGCCDFVRDDSCQGGKCTNKALVQSPFGTKCTAPHSYCTSGSDLSRCAGGNDNACKYNWPECPDQN